MSPLVAYLLSLADDRLILGHRLSEWCGHAPILEEDIALANIALDCIGQSALLYGIAAEAEGNVRTADQLVYFREGVEYRNLLLVEQTNGDFARTIVRQFLYDAFGILLFERLQRSTHAPLAAVAQKAYKELKYHFRHSSHWVVRLGDGTEESISRTQRAVNDLWRYTDEMFGAGFPEAELITSGTAVDPQLLRQEWRTSVEGIFAQTSLTIPDANTVMLTGGRTGRHTENLGHLLAEMQIVARSYPEIAW
ncbi:MAG: phenylacetate-CoA oxygenase subunit PaaC [Bacteroidetes bacterium]|nr:phenylacetate-CoA oxygenase subunit PaaC [Bacteroidota bacterium]